MADILHELTGELDHGLNDQVDLNVPWQDYLESRGGSISGFLSLLPVNGENPALELALPTSREAGYELNMSYRGLIRKQFGRKAGSSLCHGFSSFGYHVGINTSKDDSIPYICDKFGVEVVNLSGALATAKILDSKRFFAASSMIIGFGFQSAVAIDWLARYLTDQAALSRPEHLGQLELF